MYIKIKKTGYEKMSSVIKNLKTTDWIMDRRFSSLGFFVQINLCNINDTQLRCPRTSDIEGSA